MAALPATRRARSRRSPALRRAAAAAALLATAGCTSSPHSRGRPTTTTSVPAVTSTTTPSPQYAPAPYAWQRSTAPSLDVGGGPTATISAILAPQLTGQWMAFGSRSDSAGSPTATLWSSPDGLRWGASALPSGGPGQALDAAQYRMTTVAVGSTGRDDGQQAAVWLSPAPDQPFAPEPVPSSNGPSSMRLVTAGALGLFSVGSVDGRFAMWSSTSGRQWSELSGAEKVITSSPGATINALIAEGDYVYAAGSVLSGTTLQAALWATGDGIDWHLVSSAGSAFSGPGGRVIYSLAPLGTGLVAVGAVDEGLGWVPASWISPDGQSWSLPSVDFPSVPHPAPTASSLGASDGTAARDVAAIPTLAGPSTVVAAGGGPDGQVAWRSTDGLHWTSVGLPAAAATANTWRAEIVGATVGTVVIADGEPGQPYVLTGTGDGPSGPGGASPTPSATVVWTQPSADPGVFGPVRADAVPVSLRLLGGRLDLAVQVVKRPQVIGAASVSEVVLSSADATTWAAAPPGSARPGDPPELPAAGALATHLPSGWVAAGGSPPAPRMTVWTSPTGTAWKKTAELTGPVAAGGGAAGPGNVGSLGTSPSASVAAGAAADGTIVLNGVCTARLGAGPAGPGGRYVFDYVGTASTATPPAPTPSPGVSAFTITRSAAAWVSPTGASWRSGTVAPATSTGQTASMSGCVAVGDEVVAFGTAASSGVPQPALWRSPDGASWTRVAVSGFGASPGAPLVSLAAHGADWLAVANPDAYADPTEAGLAAARGPAAADGQDGGVGPTPSVEGGQEALWASLDGGGSWQLLDTATAPWMGDQTAQMDLVGYAPAAAPGHTVGGIPVVVGSVDGQLGVWTGTPVPASPAGG